MADKETLDLVCLGEPMVEFNDQSNSMFLCGFGGDVSNVAISAARQGARVGIATRIGTDSFGDDLMALWQSEGVDTTPVERDPLAPTGIYFVRHGPEGHRFEYRRAGSAASLMSPETLPRVAMSAARCIHFSGISQAISEDALGACHAAIDDAQRNGTLVSYDPNLRLLLWSLDQARQVVNRTAAHADFFLPGIDDAQQLTGLDNPEEIVAYYLNLGAKLVALTLGEKGALIGDASGNTLIPAPSVTAVDASGAGDCFDGAFLSRVLAGDDPREAAAYAVSAAAISVQGYGAVAPIPSAESVRSFMANAES